MGILAADGVRQLAGYYKNYLNRAEGALRLEPPEDVVSPSLQVYTFVQVTGRIMCRTIADQETDATPKKKSSAHAGLHTPGSSKTKGSAATPGTTPSPSAVRGAAKAAPKAAPKDMKLVPEADADDGNEDEEVADTDDDDENDDEEPDDAVAELSMLDKIVGAAKGKKDGKAKGVKKDGKKDGKKDSKAKDGQKGGKKDKK